MSGLSSLVRMIPAQLGSLQSTFYRGIVPFLLVVTILVISMAIPGMAASTPSLGTAETYGILASTYTNTTAGTTVNGDVGFTTGSPVVPAGVHTNYGSGTPYGTAGPDQGIALSTLALESCTFSFPIGAVELSTDATHGTPGIFAPGVYCSDGAMNIGGPVILSGTGTHVFRAIGALTSTAGSAVTVTGGASACNIFWTPSGAAVLGATTTFLGTVIADSGISVGASTTWTGRALAFGGTVTTDTDTITVPTCTAPPASSSSSAAPASSSSAAPASSSSSSAAPASSSASSEASLDSFGIQALRRPLISVTKIPIPLTLPGPGSVTYTYEVSNPGIYTMNNVTLADDKCGPVNYLSGDNNHDSLLQISEVWIYRCTMTLLQDTNNAATAIGYANGLPAVDIAYATVLVGTQVPPPLIHVVKTPNLFLLPFGGGAVTDTYEVSNPGIVALHSVQISDNKCDAVHYVSGDADGDNLLDVTETWIYTCKMNLASTATNTVTVTGNANDQTATDVAFATVVVAPAPVILPALHLIAPTPLAVPTSLVPLLPNTGIGPQ